MAMIDWPYIFVAMCQNDEIMHIFISSWYISCHIHNSKCHIRNIGCHICNRQFFPCNAITLGAVSNIVFAIVYVYTDIVIVES